MTKNIGTDEYIEQIKNDPIQGLDDRMLKIEYFGEYVLCKHFDNQADMSKGVHTCTAFRDIPLVIWNGKHDKPYPGDHGFRFEK
jgi:hypothetical protein